MKTFKQYCEERRLTEGGIQQPDGTVATFDPSDMDFFNKAKMQIAQAAGLDMSQPIGQQLQNKQVADNVLKAAQKNPFFKKIKNPALNSVNGLQQAFAAGDKSQPSV